MFMQLLLLFHEISARLLLRERIGVPSIRLEDLRRRIEVEGAALIPLALPESPVCSSCLPYDIIKAITSMFDFIDHYESEIHGSLHDVWDGHLRRFICSFGSHWF
jgi:hypothetical protein